MKIGAYIVDDVDLNDFIRSVDSDFKIAISMYRWAYNKNGTSRDGQVLQWRVILS